jgi:hypothetical protein
MISQFHSSRNTRLDHVHIVVLIRPESSFDLFYLALYLRFDNLGFLWYFLYDGDFRMLGCWCKS